MDFQELEYVVAVADQGSITKAAEMLFISQPTLSIYIKRLEKRLNIALFSREHRVLQLTNEGKKYVATAKKILKLRDALYDDLFGINSNTVRVGMLNSDISEFTDTIYDFQNRHPNVVVKPSLSYSTALCASVVSGELDFAYVTTYQQDYRNFFADVNCTLIKEYELCLYIAKSNPAVEKLRMSDGVLDPQYASILDTQTMLVGNFPVAKKRVFEEIFPMCNIQPQSIESFGRDGIAFLIPQLKTKNYFTVLPYSKVPDSIKIYRFPGHPCISKIRIQMEGRTMPLLQREFIKLADNVIEHKNHYYEF